jgi:transcriptional regulator with XRE-family HTH domain
MTPPSGGGPAVDLAVTRREDPEPLGRLVRRLRLEADLTLERLSAASGISDRALSDIERGTARGPQHRTVLAIARALDVPGADRAAMLRAAREGRRRGCPPAGSLPSPRDVPDFTGREPELARIAAALTPPTASGCPLVVVTGPPGHGKTSVAVRAATRLRSAFPDQLFVHLAGTSPEPPSPPVVASRVLRALTGRTTTDPGHVRRLLTDRPRLLVLDDAVDEPQVRALLPAAGRSAVLVTSRRSLAGLDGATRVVLDRLPSAEAEQLLAAIIPAGQADEADLVRLAQLCDDVPLALRIAGNRIASRPGWTAAGLVARLAVRGRRLAALTAGDLDVRAAIGASVGRLGPSARRLFRSLAALQCRTFDADQAAALVGEPSWRVERLLDELVDVHLVQPAAGNRYALRGLLQLYAEAELAAHEPRRTPGTARAAADPRRTGRAAGSGHQRRDVSCRPAAVGVGHERSTVQP